ncbi:MAG: DUF2851 family protein [Chitinophagaceae bacterium]
MNERLLQFIWQFQHFHKGELATTAGEPIQVIYQGQLNRNQGPDFSGAKIRIGAALWAGTVELHIHTSDWDKHRHQHDSNYTNVVLHVVWQHDVMTGTAPVLELAPRVPAILLQYYEELMHSAAFIPCAAGLHTVRDLTWKSWKESLLAGRLLRKAKLAETWLQQSHDHWEEVFWWLLARSFGMKVNADAFEAIARSLPVTLLARHKNRLPQLEALLFGQAGLLDQDFGEDYPASLKKEYRFLQEKYALRPVHIPVLFLRMRPGNFPTVRLAQLAMLVHHSAHLFSRVLEAGTPGEVKNWFDQPASDYWDRHYRFGEEAPVKKKKPGKALADHLIINTMAPVLFAYGNYHGRQLYKDKALRWLEETAAEHNAITDGFAHINIENMTAYDSQALTELKNEYCDKRRCLDCAAGNFLLKAKSYPAGEPFADS